MLKKVAETSIYGNDQIVFFMELIYLQLDYSTANAMGFDVGSFQGYFHNLSRLLCKGRQVNCLCHDEVDL